MKRIIKKILMNIIVIVSIIFIFSCNNKITKSNINNENNNVINENKTNKSEKYTLWSYSINLPEDFVENSKTPENIIFLVNRVPVIINRMLLGDDYTETKVEELKKDLYRSSTKRFNKLTSERVEEVKFDSTKGLLCKYIGYIQGNNEYIQSNEFIQESYILNDENEKSIYVFTVFCLNDDENKNIIKKFEDMIGSLRKN